MARAFKRLDRAAIRRLQPGQKITEHGIEAERLPDGDVRYTVNVMVDGKRIHRVIGRESEHVTRTQAEDFIAKARQDSRADRLGLPQGRKLALGFSAAADAYLKRLEESGGKNVKAKKAQFEQHLKPFFGDQRLDAITTFTVDRYKKRRLEAKAEPGTVNRELAALSHLFRMGVEWKWLRERPCAWKALPEPEFRVETLTDAEADALVKAAVADVDTYLWLFVLFGLNTAMRHSEILRARFDQVDFDKLRLYIPQAKAGQREQPITPELAEVLRKEREMRDDRQGWIFPTYRPKYAKGEHRTQLGRPFARAVKRANLDPKRVTPHVMRHTAITNLVMAGVDLPTIQKISGHKTLAMVLRYTKLHGSHINQAIAKIGRTVPDLQATEPERTDAQELHRPGLRAV